MALLTELGGVYDGRFGRPPVRELPYWMTGAAWIPATACISDQAATQSWQTTFRATEKLTFNLALS